MRKENHRLRDRRRFRVLFRRRLRRYRRPLEKRWRAVKAWLVFCVAALASRFSDDYGFRLVMRMPWPKFGSILLVVGLVVWGGSELWFSSQEQNAASDLRPSLIGAGVALVGAAFFFWRNWIADKQLKNTNKQLETSQEQLKNAQTSLQQERYKESVELLGNESQVVRIGGLYALHQLAEDFPKEWALPVLDLMCLFVRTPPLDKDKSEETPDQDKAERSGKKQLRLDVQEAVQLLGLRGFGRREKEKLEQEKAKKEEKGRSPGRGRVDFYGADLAWGIWRGVDLGGAFFSETTLTGASFRDATLTRAFFRETRLEKANFSGVRLEGALFSEATLTEACFDEATLTGAIFERARLERAHFFMAKLTGAWFSEATLTSAIFGGAKLDGARFKKAMLENASFFQATLTGANFEGATLTDANFSGATLADANFEGADITRASLMYADLSGVILLVYRDFIGDYPKFNPVKGVTRGQFEEAWIEKDRPPVKIEEMLGEDMHTTWPPTRTPPVALTEAEWKKIGLDSQPHFLPDLPPPDQRVWPL